MAQRAFIKKGDLIFVLAFLAFVAGVLWYRQTQPPRRGQLGGGDGGQPGSGPL